MLVFIYIMGYPKRSIDYKGDSGFGRSKSIFPSSVPDKGTGGLLRIAAAGFEPRGRQGWGLPKRHDKSNVNHRSQAIMGLTVCTSVNIETRKLDRRGLNRSKGQAVAAPGRPKPPKAIWVVWELFQIS